MSSIKKLASQTLYYGISSVIGRMLHFFIIPLQTRRLANEELGFISELYSYIAVLNILYVFGMELAFFRFSKNIKKNDNNLINNQKESFSAAFIILLFSSFLISSILILVAPKIAFYIGHDNHPIYIYYISAILFIDALSAIPMALLRFQNKAKLFASIQVSKIFIFIVLYIFILYFFDEIYNGKKLIFLQKFILSFYNPNKKIEYLLLANIISSLFGLIIVLNNFKNLKLPINLNLIKKMFTYAFPLVLVGLMGVSNEMFSRISIKYLIPINLYDKNGEALLGIFSSCFKLSLLMNLCIQAYRYAAEPFFFSEAIKNDHKAKFAKVMHIFIVIMCFLMFFLSVNLDLISHIMLGPRFKEGIEIVPFAMLSYLFLGIYYNMSSWFKITNKTYFAILFTLISFLLSISIIIILVPLIGYWGSIIAFVSSNLCMVILCYAFGQKYYPIPYNLKKDSAYILMCILSIVLIRKLLPISLCLKTIYGLITTIIFAVIIYNLEKKNIFLIFKDSKKKY